MICTERLKSHQSLVGVVAEPDEECNWHSRPADGSAFQEPGLSGGLFISVVGVVPYQLQKHCFGIGHRSDAEE